MGRQPLKIPNGLLIFRNLSFVGFWLRRWKEGATREEVFETYRMLAELVDRGVLHTPVHRVFALEEIGEAVVEAGRERRGGKVLVGLGGPY
jgi:trans-2-enoyl-CoA reductase